MSNEKRYVDAMDRTRLLVPVRDPLNMVRAGTVECRVYFKGSGYVGKTNAPVALFTDTPEGGLSHYGFVLLGAKPEATNSRGA